MTDTPIEGQVLLVTAAKASVGPDRLSELVETAQEHVDGRRDSYASEFERAATTDDAAVFFVHEGHWSEVGERLGFDRRESDAVERAHEEQLLRVGRREDRESEFERALEIREVAFVNSSR